MAAEGSWRGGTVREVFRDHNYRLLWAGQALALLGEQINLIALPWLALQLTGDALALGSVLAARSLPSAILTLAGGVTTDRFSPRLIMLASDAVRLALACLLVFAVLTGATTLWLLYAVSLAFGVLSAFSQPAAGSIIPAVLPGPRLQTANSLFQSLTQFAAFAGPALAGMVIARAPAAGSAPGQPAPGIAAAFGLYALGLLVSVSTLPMLRLPPCPVQSAGEGEAHPLEALAAGFRYIRQDPLLRTLIALLLALNLVLAGPLAVGIPMLSRLRLPEGAAAFGLIAAGFGAGNLLGSLLAGVLRRTARLGLLLTALIAGFGAGLWIISQAQSTWVAIVALLIIGTGNGYLGVIVRTLLHRRTPPHLLGRVMSLYFFGKSALVPVSQAVSGAVIGLSLEGFFQGAGILLVALAAWLALSPTPRLLEAEAQQAL